MIPTMVPRLSKMSKKSIVSTQTQKSGESRSVHENWQNSGAGVSGSENRLSGSVVTPRGMPASVTIMILSKSPPRSRMIANVPVSTKPNRKSNEDGLVKVLI